MSLISEGCRDKWQTLKHLSKFYSSTLRGLFRKQRIKIPKAKLITRQSFYFSRKQYDKWHHLFDVDPKAIYVPFSYYSPAVVSCFLKVMNKLQINYKNLLHLKHEETFHQTAPIAFNKKYYAYTELEDIILLRQGTIAILLKTTL